MIIIDTKHRRLLQGIFIVRESMSREPLKCALSVMCIDEDARSTELHVFTCAYTKRRGQLTPILQHENKREMISMWDQNGSTTISCC